MALLVLLGIVGCGPTWDHGPAIGAEGDTDTDADSDTDTDTDSDTDTDTDTDTDAVKVSEDAVGSCLEAADLAAATSLTVTTLYEGDLPYDQADWDTIPAITVVDTDQGYADLQTTTGLTLPAVDFGASRLVVATDSRIGTCGMSVEEVLAYALSSDGMSNYVEAHMRTDGSGGCDAVCDGIASRIVIVEVPGAGGVQACRRTATWCDQ